jgi:hypothetical protein
MTTDFIADLEAELVAAARRRGTRRSVPRPRLVPVVAAIAIVVAALAVLRGVDRSRTADDQPVPPGPGVVVTLPAAERVSDDAGCRAGIDSQIPGKPQLAVFERPQTIQDRFMAGGFGALPVDAVDEDSLRAPGAVGGIHLIRVGGVSGRCDAEQRPLDPGACLIVGNEVVAARCFGDEEVARGTAIAVAPVPAAKTTDWVYGIAPDGVDRVRLSWQGGTVTTRVLENGYATRLVGVKAGDGVRVELVPSASGCGPSEAAYRAVAALRDAPAAETPAALEHAMADLGSHGAWRRYARVVGHRDGVELWVVPDLPCDRPAAAEERVCILPTGGSLLCDTPDTLRRRGAWIKYGQGALTTVAGIAPAGARYADVRIRDLVHPFPVRHGVFGGMIVDESGDPAHVTYR